MTGEIVEGLLLDSGDTLVRPIQGRWWPPPYFRRIVIEHGFAHLDWDRIDQAVQEGMKYLDANHSVRDENEERAQFETYFEILLDALGLPDPPDELIEDLGSASVDELEIEPFPETKRSLENLRDEGLRLGILSNAWPSLERKYAKLGLREFFHVFVISSQVGCCKPDERIFQTAIEGMELPRQRIIFIDDYPPYVRKAIEIGMQGIVMARHGKDDAAGLKCVENLAQLVDLMKGTAS
jgi:putative hydrolase of the HAD superfamily